jgi:probable HAF family extracellular repeat protein
MDWPERTNLRRCVRRSIATAVATLAVAMAEAPAASSSPSSPFPGFLLDRGRYIPFEASDPSVQLGPSGINNRGEIVGEYIIASSKESILLRDRRGTITSFDVPGAQGTEATDINDRGQIVGTYSEDTPIVNNSARPRAYVLDRFGRGKFTRIDFPGASLTVASGINNRGQVVGGYLDAEGRPHGFLWDKGRFTTIDVPGAPNTVAFGINDRGQIVGTYENPDAAPDAQPSLMQMPMMMSGL